jgi:hypothetical protein
MLRLERLMLWFEEAAAAAGEAIVATGDDGKVMTMRVAGPVVTGTAATVFCSH